MDRNLPRDWMWSEAFAMLARAENLHREIFRPTPSNSRRPAWEPPIDILETEHDVLVLVALPGVDADQVEAAIEGADLVIAGARILPPEMQTAVIHRLELPQGRFERRVQLPARQYQGVRRSAGRGCLLIILEKTEAHRG